MEWKISRNFTFDKGTCSANCQTRSKSGRNKVGFYMKITKISDVLKGTDVLEGTINGEGEDECIFLAPHSPRYVKV